MKNKSIILFFLILILVSCGNENISSSLNQSYSSSSNIELSSSSINLNYFSFYYQLANEKDEIISDINQINEEIETIRTKISFLGINDFNVCSEDNSLIKIDLHNDYLPHLTIIQRIIECSNDISFRDENGNLLATKEEMLDLNESAILAATSNPYIKLNLSSEGINKFDNEIIPIVGEDNKVIIWLGYNDSINQTDKYSEYEDLLQKISQNGLELLNLEEQFLFNYYNYKILTISTISSSLIESGGLSGVGASFFVSKSDYLFEEGKSLVRIINSSKSTYKLNNISNG